MKTYKFDEQKSILWSEQLDESTHQSGFFRVGQTEQRETKPAEPILDDEGNETGEYTKPEFETVDVYQELVDSGVEIEPYVKPEPTPHELKMVGVEFDGVMCSATKFDQFGLASIEGRVRSGLTVDFHFENGNTLELTPDNLDAFEAVWFPFRVSFF